VTRGSTGHALPEWLISARALLASTGQSEATTSQAQALAAAAFGFKSWNHLCGLIPAGEPKSAWWSMCAPYYVHGEDASDHATIRVYCDPIEGFIDFCSRAARACDVRVLLRCTIPAFSTRYRFFH
jgi:hypothetical protein